MFPVLFISGQFLRPGVHGTDIGKPQLSHRIIQKADSFVKGIHQRYLQARIYNGQRQARKSGACTHIDQSGTLRHGLTGYGLYKRQTVYKMLCIDFFHIRDGRQIHDLVPQDQVFIIGQELLFLHIRKPDAESSQLFLKSLFHSGLFHVKHFCMEIFLRDPLFAFFFFFQFKIFICHLFSSIAAAAPDLSCMD